MYDVFYCVHHLFIIATIFVVLHWNSTLAWLFPSVMMYTACRPLSSSNAFTPVPVREFTTLSSDVVKVVLERSTMHAGEFKVGNFVYLNVPAISKLQWHHFTISSSPQTSPNTFTILLKSLGDWTQELVKYPVECKKNSILPTVYMDGFYGASLEFYDEYATMCLIGGGIGVTPVLAILEDQVAKLHKSTSLITKKVPVPFAEPLRSPISRVIVYTTSFILALLIWIIVKYGNKIQVHDDNLWSLQNFVEITLVILVALLRFLVFSFIEDKKKQKSASTSGQAATPGAVKPYASDVHTVCDFITEYRVEVGHRPKINELMRKVHHEHKQFITSRPETVTNGNSTIGVFISGPKALKDCTVNAIADIGALDFDIHEDEFKL
ncbi:hypothetical protein ON010_g18034 [Phytophthora cinnamomi]|nr:hypothetical protein ON010_g18034 [Phytophthora cinnamomi]